MSKIILNGIEYGEGIGGGGGGGHTIVDPTGTDMPQENKLQFTGAVNVSDDSANGQTVVDIEGGGNYYLNTIYSTEEKKIGYWTDSKPLYQKTIPFTTDSGSNTTNYVHGIANIDTVASYSGVIVRADGTSIDINDSRWQGNAEDLVGCIVNKNSISVFVNYTGYRNLPVYVTIQYTKTTDTPELNPQTGGVIYLPTIYSDEEREVGVWRNEKPLYQKTYHFDSLVTLNSNTWVDTGFKISNSVIVGNSVAFRDDNVAGQSFPVIVSADIGTNQAIELLQTRNSSISISGFTIQYTKTTDTAGSGSWTPSGAKAVHYSTNEQVIGTWIDGKPRYEITLSGSGSYSAGAELVVPLPTNADKVVIMGGYVDIGTDWLPLNLTLGVGTGTTNGVYCYPNKSTGIHIYSSAWTFSEYNVTVQYCKTTD